MTLNKVKNFPIGFNFNYLSLSKIDVTASAFYYLSKFLSVARGSVCTYIILFMGKN